MSKKFREIIEESRKLHEEYKKREKKEWTSEAIMLEIQKQVGELSKFIMSKEGYYMKARDDMEQYKATKQKISDEIFDVIFNLIRLADKYNIDIEEEYIKQINLAYNWFEKNE